MSSRNGQNKSRARSKAGQPQGKRPLVVGIGASAGGLEAFRTFFDHMPADAGIGFVLVQHLDPDHHSMLAELLSTHTDMPVVEAEDGMQVAADHVFIIPPDATLTIEHGRLQVETPAPARATRRPIDTFFTSLAADQGENAVCVVLSGTGSDGTLGLKKIKEHGGFALAQEGLDKTAARGMPASATATGLVDYCVPIEAMPARLIDYQHHLHQVEPRKDANGNRRDASGYLDTITGLVRNAVGHDFSQYKQNTLVRRVQRRMQVLQIGAVPAYIDRLRGDSHEIERLFDDLLIGVTQFFRDPDAWVALERTVISKLFDSKTVADEIRIWVPGCGTGEEAYSIAMLLAEAMDRTQAKPTVQIFGTDIDERSIEIARIGVYPKALPGLSAERRERHFVVDEDGEYRPNKAIRAMCVFAPHSVVKDPPFSKLDLISCRNLLIYMNNDLQDRVVRKFHYALRPGGWLFLGASEGVTRSTDLFATADKKHRLFQRKEVERVGLLDVMTPAAPATRTRPARALEHGVPRSGGGDALDRRVGRVMEKYAIPYVVIDARHEILRFSGGTVGRYLEPSAGTASFHLLGMVNKALRPATRAAVQQAFDEGEPVVQANLPLRIDGEARAITIIVEPLDPARNGGVKQCVVAFRDAGPAGGGAAAGAGAAGDVAALEHELRVTRAQLNSAIADLETANEELRSANEEYQSVNEELQSSNEELETSKEEMQSINEELQTVNAELSHKNDALQAANSDLRNLLENTQIATLFLDNDLHIKNFTPGVRDLFHLREGDRGRPVTDIVTRLDYGALRRDAEKVLRDLTLVEREVELVDGAPQTFIMRIRPYRTVDNVIDGVVITFTDITERKRGEAERARLAAIVESSDDAIVSKDLNGIIQTWNAGAERIFGYTAGEVVGKSITLLMPDDRPDEEQGILARLRRGESVDHYETVRRRKDGVLIHISLTISPIRNATGEIIGASKIARDISPRLKHEAQRELLLHELSHRVKNTLATVQSIMTQTLRHAPAPEDFRDVFGKRIRSLAKTHDLLTHGGWRGAGLRDLVQSELKPYGGRKKDPRWQAIGEDVKIAPTQVVALGMALHELATNATKHGALSAAHGRVDVSWEVADVGKKPMLRLSWTERDGPPPTPPQRRGFGLQLIEEGLAYELDAEVQLDFGPAGLTCTIEVPLKRTAPDAAS